jgi:microcystin-dependent protein
MEAFIGTVFTFAFNFAPRGFATCQGQILSIAQNTALFSLLGTTYGGNGQSTFALPDLQGRVPNGQGQGPGLSPYSMGQLAGTETITLLQPNMPAHNHALMATAASADSATPVADHILGGANGEDANLGSVTVKVYAPAAGSNPIALSPISIGIAGASMPIPILSPYLTLNYSICMEGIFPSRP